MDADVADCAVEERPESMQNGVLSSEPDEEASVKTSSKSPSGLKGAVAQSLVTENGTDSQDRLSGDECQETSKHDMDQQDHHVTNGLVNGESDEQACGKSGDCGRNDTNGSSMSSADAGIDNESEKDTVKKEDGRNDNDESSSIPSTGAVNDGESGKDAVKKEDTTCAYSENVPKNSDDEGRDVKVEKASGGTEKEKMEVDGAVNGVETEHDVKSVKVEDGVTDDVKEESKSMERIRDSEKENMKVEKDCSKVEGVGDVDKSEIESKESKEVVKKETGELGKKEADAKIEKNDTSESSLDSSSSSEKNVKEDDSDVITIDEKTTDDTKDDNDVEIVGASLAPNPSLLGSVPQVLNAFPTSQGVVYLSGAPTMASILATPAPNASFSKTNVMYPISSHQQPVLLSQGGFVFTPQGLVPSSQVAGFNKMAGNFGGKVVPAMTPQAPPKPQSSLDQIELIRWEIVNRINTRPKYFKPSPSQELGPLAKFLFDVGSDLIKESVYNELVTIQSMKFNDDKLGDKEKADLEKLKEIEKDLHATIGHLKLKLKKRCEGCNFRTESNSVLYHHKQFPHEDGRNLNCSQYPCKFSAKQPAQFRFHMEAFHNVAPRLYDRRSFYECDLCPYENNQLAKLEQHKIRCVKQFRPMFNLHPSCLSGAEINLCLENIFYKQVIPKHIKALQERQAVEKAALEAAKTALAAQQKKKEEAARAMLAKQPRIIPALPYGGHRAPSFGGNLIPHQQNPSARPRQQTPRGGRSGTVASMIKSRQPSPNAAPNVTAPKAQTPATKGFEVCEICGGYVKDRKALRIHFFYAHRIDLPFNLFERPLAPLYCATCFERFWTAQGLRKHIDVHREENLMGSGAAGKCISCGHQVPNVLTHMRIVHNRELHHFLNALMCVFCGKSFNARGDVERHMKTVHGNAHLQNTQPQPMAPVPTLPQNHLPQQAQPQPQRQQQQQRPPSSTPAQPSDLSRGKPVPAQDKNLVKGSVCVLCNLNFGRNCDLTRHCMRVHHTCMKCGMVVIDKASLLKHTCLTSHSGTRDCTLCNEDGFHPAYYIKHLRDKHLKNFSIKVQRLSKETIEREPKQPYPYKDPKNNLVEISDSEEEEQEVIPVENVTTSAAKKRKMGPVCRIRNAPVGGKGEDSSDEDQGAKDSKSSTGQDVIDIDSPASTPSPRKRPHGSDSDGSNTRADSKRLK